MKGKRDLNILYKPQKEEPKVIDIPAAEVKKEDGGEVEVNAEMAVPVSATSSAIETGEKETIAEKSGKMEVDKVEGQ